jgi:drug/metabolite transporter (DMT)-like permease
MILLGVLLIVLGALLGISLLYQIGVLLLVVGVILWALGASGRPLGGRNHWY